MRSPLLALILVLAGCGLDKNGTGPLESDAGPGDADAEPPIQSATEDHYVAEASPDVVDAPMDSCVSSLPTGWSLVYYETTLGLCPDSYANHDAVTNPQAQTGACTCPRCARHDAALVRHGDARGQDRPAVRDPRLLAGHHRPRLQRAHADGEDAGDALRERPPHDRWRVHGDLADRHEHGHRDVRPDVRDPSGDLESACEDPAPSGFSACLVSPGDVPCPTGSPYATRTVVADSETLMCSACSTCTVTGTCASANLDVYADPGCKMLIQNIVAYGACTPAGAGTQGKNISNT